MKRSFTLIEILIYLSVLAIIISAVISFFIWVNQSNAKTKAMREVIDNGRRATEVITYEIKEAKGIYFPTSVFSSNPGQLSLITSKYLPEEETATYIDFYICGTQICFKKESQDPIVLTSDDTEIKSLIFKEIATKKNNPSIQIELKIDYKTPSTNPSYQASATLESTASLRLY